MLFSIGHSLRDFGIIKRILAGRVELPLIFITVIGAALLSLLNLVIVKMNSSSDHFVMFVQLQSALLILGAIFERSTYTIFLRIHSIRIVRFSAWLYWGVAVLNFICLSYVIAFSEMIEWFQLSAMTPCYLCGSILAAERTAFLRSRNKNLLSQFWFVGARPVIFFFLLTPFLVFGENVIQSLISMYCISNFLTQIVILINFRELRKSNARFLCVMQENMREFLKIALASLGSMLPIQLMMLDAAPKLSADELIFMRIVERSVLPFKSLLTVVANARSKIFARGISLSRTEKSNFRKKIIAIGFLMSAGAVLVIFLLAHYILNGLDISICFGVVFFYLGSFFTIYVGPAALYLTMRGLNNFVVGSTGLSCIVTLIGYYVSPKHLVTILILIAIHTFLINIIVYFKVVAVTGSRRYW